MIDLHLHTTASDGRCSPREVVVRSAAAGVSVIAVTDHDTTEAIAEVRAAVPEFGLQAISGIEITAVEEGRDLHVLGYLFDPLNEALGAFLQAARRARIARVEAIGSRLAALGVPWILSRWCGRPLSRAGDLSGGRKSPRPWSTLGMSPTLRRRSTVGSATDALAVFPVRAQLLRR